MSFLHAWPKLKNFLWFMDTRISQAKVKQNLQHTLSSAPDAPFIFSAIFFRSIPRIKFIFLECIFKMSNRDCKSIKLISARKSNVGNGLLTILKRIWQKRWAANIFIGIWELNFSINSSRPKKSLIQNVNSIGSHQYLRTPVIHSWISNNAIPKASYILKPQDLKQNQKKATG